MNDCEVERPVFLLRNLILAQFTFPKDLNIYIMVPGYFLKVEFIMEFTGLKSAKAYEILNKVKAFKSKDKDYLPIITDWPECEGWNVNTFLIFAYGTREEAVHYFVNEIKNEPRKIILDGKYGGNAVIEIPPPSHPALKDMEITPEGTIPGLEKKQEDAPEEKKKKKG